MSKRTIQTILTLKDQISRPIVKVTAKTKELERQTKSANNQLAKFGQNAVKHIDKLVVSSGKAAIGLGAVGTALAFKTGFGEATNLEGYRTQLETATRSAQKAGNIMKWSVDLANATPFETGSVVEMAAKFEAMGMSAKKWGTITADMAGATNKDVIQATEAIIDAQTGELERLKEFGITKAMIAKKAGELYRNQEVVNAKGQIVDQEKFNDALMKLMEDKYKGGAAKQAKTIKGMWSTVTGVVKTSLANILGMQNDGTIKAGSMLDLAKKKVQQLADTLTKWQNDGTIQRIAKQVTTTVTQIIKGITRIIKFIQEHKTLITNVLVIIGSFYIAVKVAMAVAKAIKMVQIAMLLLNGTLVLSPLGWLVIILGAVIAVGVLLYKNWDTIKKKAGELWSAIKSAFSPLKDFFAGIWSGVKSGFRSFINFIIGGINSFTKTLSWIPKKLSKVPGFGWAKNFIIPEIPLFAKGGIATKPSIFGEAGAEIAIPLNHSTRSKQLVRKADSIVNGKSPSTNKPRYEFNFHIQNLYGAEDVADEFGEIVIKKVIMALDNM